MRHLLGNNLFDLEHDAWLPRRRALQPIFTKKRVEEFAGQMVEAAEAVAGSWVDGGSVDLDAQSRRVTLRALGRSVLGADLDQRPESIAQPMEIALSYIANRTAAPIKAPKWLPTVARHRARTAGAQLRGFGGDIVKACRQDPAREAPLVRAMLSAVDPGTGIPLTDREIADDLIAFMLAGHDTTATAIAYALWQLGRRPELQDRVLAEAAAAGGSGSLGPAAVPRLNLTVAVLNEALRLCPPAAATSRVAVRDIEVDGYRVEAGTMLVFGIYAVQRDPGLWPDPLTFDPERFINGAAKRVDRWQFLPFGAGPRSCIGDHFAMLEATLALATIVRSVQIRSSADSFPIKVPFTTAAAEPIMAVVRQRRSR